MSQVLLVNMPFANLRWPNLGLGLLKAAVRRAGVSCTVADWNFDFAERTGLDRYHWVADHFAFVLGGERLFARHYFGDILPPDREYFENVLTPADADFSWNDFLEFQSLQEHVPSFLRDCLAGVPEDCRVVGFAATFQQTFASLCLARELKRQRPELITAFGGAACEEEMGLELLRQFPEIDLVFLGEADHAFPDVVVRLLEGRLDRLPPGVAGRYPSVPATTPDTATPTAACRRLTVSNLATLPYPDFDDYFQRYRQSSFRGEFEPLLFFETSRGCWWGEKHHCAFCGLNGRSLAFRSKQPQRVLDELRFLVHRHGITQGCAADNIFDYRYFQSLLPQLKSADFHLAFVYEMKTNLRRDQVRQLLEAGLGAAQLGIETFLTDVLRSIHKGATALHNLQTLRWFSEAGIEVKWNILYGFPGERPEDYRRLVALLEKISHLAPPLAVGRVRMDRFAPFFESPQQYGLLDVRPAEAFRYVYPFPEDVLQRLAYYFQFHHADGHDPAPLARELLATVDRWQGLAGQATLSMWQRDDGVLLITDTRPIARQFQYRLSPQQAALYRFCDTGRSWRAVKRYLDHPPKPAQEDTPPATARQWIEQWLEDALLVELDGQFLSLATHAPEQSDLHAAARARIAY